MKTTTKELLRALPSVSAMLEHEEVRGWLQGLPRSSVVDAVQATLQAARQAIMQGDQREPASLETLLALAEQELRYATPRSRRLSRGRRAIAVSSTISEPVGAVGGNGTLSIPCARSPVRKRPRWSTTTPPQPA